MLHSEPYQYRSLAQDFIDAEAENETINTDQQQEILFRSLDDSHTQPPSRHESIPGPKT